MERTSWLLQFFKWDHLPEALAEVSRPFQGIANGIMALPNNPEREEALRKLLEAKDCAVRCKVAGHQE